MIYLATVLMAIAGLIWGFREYQHKDLACFEKAFGANKQSFFGSESWKRKYKDWDAGDKSAAFPLAMTFPFNDFWHSSKYVFGILLTTGTALAVNNIDSLFLWSSESKVIVAGAYAFFIQGMSGGIGWHIIHNLIITKNANK